MSLIHTLVDIFIPHLLHSSRFIQSGSCFSLRVIITIDHFDGDGVDFCQQRNQSKEKDFPWRLLSLISAQYTQRFRRYFDISSLIEVLKLPQAVGIILTFDITSLHSNTVYFPFCGKGPFYN